MKAKIKIFENSSKTALEWEVNHWFSTIGTVVLKQVKFNVIQTNDGLRFYVFIQYSQSQ